MDNDGRNAESGTTDINGAARFFGVSRKTFCSRIMPSIPALCVSAPTAKRKCRRFSRSALEMAMETLAQKPAA